MTKDFIEKNLLSDTGRLKRKKLNELNLSEEDVYIKFYNIEVPICKNKDCNKKAKFISFTKGFNKYCCKKCQNIGIKMYSNETVKNMDSKDITKEYISSILDKNGKPNANITRFLPLSIEELYVIYHGIEKPICKNKNCNENTNFKNFGEGFYDYCSNKCAQNSEKVRQKQSDTLFTNYGTRDPLEIKDGRKKGISYITSEENFKKQEEYNMIKFGGKTSFSSAEVQDKCKKSIVKKYDVENIMYSKLFIDDKFIPILKTKRKDTYVKKYGEEHPMKLDSIKQKVKTTNESNGYWITEDQVKDFNSYTRLVWRYTNKNDLSVLENIDKRAHTKDGYHLDHKYSIYQGFKDSIDAKIIGNICNLEMLQSGQNLSKNRKCSITKDELLSSYTV